MITVLMTDSNSDSLHVEQSVLGDTIAVRADNREQIQVLIAHQTIIDESFLDQYPRLRGVVRRGVGFDKVDLDACRTRGICVANVPDYCTDEVADSAIAMILNAVRGHSEISHKLRRNRSVWQADALRRVRRTSNLALGVVGAGRIGGAVLQRARRFGFRLYYFDPAVERIEGADRLMNLPSLLRESDIVSLHVPADSQTSGMVDKEFIDAMKVGSVLVNTARGSLISDERVIVDALQDGKLDAVAVDVLCNEPPVDSPIFEVWSDQDSDLAGKIQLTPHIAFHSLEAEEDVRRKAAEEALRILRGESPRSLVS